MEFWRIKSNEMHLSKIKYEKNELEKLISDLKKVDIYSLFTYFIICAFFGWIFETMAVLIQTGRLTDRGYLFVQKPLSYYFIFLKNIPFIRDIPVVWGLPIIEMYGVGGIIVVFLFGHLKNRPVILFFMGMVFMTFFELATSYLCDYVLHRSFWDYSKEFLNFQGRICLRSSLVWGLLSVFAVKFLIPMLEFIYVDVKKIKHYKMIISIFIAYTFICAIYKYFFFVNYIH